jgi:hypothetical protein
MNLQDLRATADFLRWTRAFVLERGPREAAFQSTKTRRLGLGLERDVEAGLSVISAFS